MKKKQDLSEILDKCLIEMREGKTVKDCLDEHPSRAKDLKPLLKTVEKLTLLGREEPSPEFVRSTKERILNRAAQQIILLSKPPEIEKVESPAVFKQPYRPRIWLIRMAFAAVLVLLLASGAVAASADTLPGDLLYPVKRTAENFRVAITFDSSSRTELQLDLVEERLREADQLLKARKNELAEDILQEASDRFEQSMESVLNLDEREELLERLISLSARHQSILRAVYERSPEAAKDSIYQAIEESQKGHKEAVDALNQRKGQPPAEKETETGKPEEPQKGKPAGQKGRGESQSQGNNK